MVLGHVAVGLMAAVPRVLHHVNEVVVVIDAHRDVCVQIQKVVPAHDTRLVDGVEAAEVEELLLGALAGEEVFALRHVEGLEEVFDEHVASLQLVEVVEGALHGFKAFAGQGLTEGIEELFVADSTVAIHIVVLKQNLQLDLGREQAELAETVLELLGVEEAVAVGVQLPEDCADRSGVHPAALGQNHPEVVVDLVDFYLQADSEKVGHMRFK